MEAKDAVNADSRERKKRKRVEEKVRRIRGGVIRGKKKRKIRVRSGKETVE
ncbi:hypothetical protein WN55_01221 [Dufourea novaeangliae]|uniref:Uncharacterized protein n=1 Tax=Dufourea novaeangliae TaxID=178035 RepID=A0A154NWK1_DUFNO|nr:hypothetical protein WN55_01221 [Dufourea novaeangliae]